MIKLYGVPGSRACRPLWMLEEVGVPYENIPTHFATGETHRPEYLALNPNGHVPTLVDGDLVLWESMAINLYLAAKYGCGTFWPNELADQARCIQWSFWLMTEVETPLVTALLHRAFYPEPQRNARLADESEVALAKPFKVLDTHLSDRRFIVGNGVSVADINAASVIFWTRLARVEIKPFPNLGRWLTSCLERPAAVRLLAKLRG